MDCKLPVASRTIVFQAIPLFDSILRFLPWPLQRAKWAATCKSWLVRAAKMKCPDSCTWDKGWVLGKPCKGKCKQCNHFVTVDLDLDIRGAESVDAKFWEFYHCSEYSDDDEDPVFTSVSEIQSHCGTCRIRYQAALPQHRFWKWMASCTRDHVSVHGDLCQKISLWFQTFRCTVGEMVPETKNVHIKLWMSASATRDVEHSTSDWLSFSPHMEKLEIVDESRDWGYHCEEEEDTKKRQRWESATAEEVQQIISALRRTFGRDDGKQKHSIKSFMTNLPFWQEMLRAIPQLKEAYCRYTSNLQKDHISTAQLPVMLHLQCFSMRNSLSGSFSDLFSKWPSLTSLTCIPPFELTSDDKAEKRLEALSLVPTVYEKDIDIPESTLTGVSRLPLRKLEIHSCALSVEKLELLLKPNNILSSNLRSLTFDPVGHLSQHLKALNCCSLLEVVGIMGKDVCRPHSLILDCCPNWPNLTELWVTNNTRGLVYPKFFKQMSKKCPSIATIRMGSSIVVVTEDQKSLTSGLVALVRDKCVNYIELPNLVYTPRLMHTLSNSLEYLVVHYLKGFVFHDFSDAQTLKHVYLDCANANQDDCRRSFATFRPQSGNITSCKKNKGIDDIEQFNGEK